VKENYPLTSLRLATILVDDCPEAIPNAPPKIKKEFECELWRGQSDQEMDLSEVLKKNTAF
jgi:hypothetical protein